MSDSRSNRRRSGEVVKSDKKSDETETIEKSIIESPKQVESKKRPPPVSSTPSDTVVDDARKESDSGGGNCKVEKPTKLDRSDPCMVPSSGQFFFHDNRSTNSVGGRSSGRGGNTRNDDDTRNR